MSIEIKQTVTREISVPRWLFRPRMLLESVNTVFCGFRLVVVSWDRRIVVGRRRTKVWYTVDVTWRRDTPYRWGFRVYHWTPFNSLVYLLLLSLMSRKLPNA